MKALGKTGFSDKSFEPNVLVILLFLKGQSHEKVGEMSVWGISLGPN
jgi:hypothetical protein